jgi:hypothetical protein
MFASIKNWYLYKVPRLTCEQLVSDLPKRRKYWAELSAILCSGLTEEEMRTLAFDLKQAGYCWADIDHMFCFEVIPAVYIPLNIFADAISCFDEDILQSRTLKNYNRYLYKWYYFCPTGWFASRAYKDDLRLLKSIFFEIGPSRDE